MIYQLEDLMKHARGRGDVCEINRRWVPARPLTGGARFQMKAAWAVLTGKADAFVWPEGQ